jgi:hypothetical protein
VDKWPARRDDGVRATKGARLGLRVRALASALLVVLAAGCFTYPGALREFDSVIRLDVAPELQASRRPIVYEQEPSRYYWGIRQFEGTGIDRAMIWLFGARPVPIPVDNPSEFARRRMRILARLAEGDLRRTATVAMRVHLVATADVSQLNRVEALRAAGRLLAGLRVDPLADLQARLRGFPPADLRELEPGWPGKPGERDAATRQRHLLALAATILRPANDPTIQRQTIRLLADALRLERDPVVRRATRVALRQAIDNGLSWLLLRSLYPTLATPDEREAAFHELRTLGGPKSVPALLALVGGTGRDSFFLRDEPTSVRRSIVAACARLRSPLAEEGFELDKGQVGPAPVQVLFDVALHDPDPGLRRVALEGLAYSLGRERDFDPEWARNWYRDWALERL